MVLTLDFVQRTALSILTRNLTDNISNNLHSNNKKISRVFVTNTKYSLIIILIVTLYLTCIFAATRNSSTNHTWSDASMSRIGPVAFCVAYDLHSHFLQNGAGRASLLKSKY